jgi:hypothetical protein
MRARRQVEERATSGSDDGFNHTTANALGLEVPLALLLRVDDGRCMTASAQSVQISSAPKVAARPLLPVCDRNAAMPRFVESGQSTKSLRDSPLKRGA